MKIIPVWLRVLASLYVLTALVLLAVGGVYGMFLRTDPPAWTDDVAYWWATVGVVVAFGAWMVLMLVVLTKWVIAPLRKPASPPDKGQTE